MRAFRAVDRKTPVVLMGYANPIERYGTTRFVAAAKEAGVDGVLVVDYPPEECAEFAAGLKRAGIDPIFLIAPTSSDARIASVAEVAQRIRLPCVAERRDRCRPLRHRRRQGHDARESRRT